MKIPDNLTDEDALFLSDIFPTGYQGAEMGEIKPGESVVVFGCGPVGLFAAKSAWLVGAGRVIAVDHGPERLESARKFAGVEPIDFTKLPHVVGELKQLCGGRGPDACIDAVGMEAEGSF